MPKRMEKIECNFIDQSRRMRWVGHAILRDKERNA